MPKLNDETISTQDLKDSYFGYSAVTIENLGATEYTLVTIAVDVSGSVSSFKTEMEKCIAAIMDACKCSPRADNLLIRLITFSDDVEEMHGFKLLENCDTKDYINCLEIKGITSLFDATYSSIEATRDYAIQLYDNDFDVNGIVFVITDGYDNNSTKSCENIKDLMDSMKKEEKMESLVSIIIGVGISSQSNADTYLNEFKDDSGLDQFVKIDKATAVELAKITGFVSQSIVSQSQSLGSGSVSKPFFLDI